MVDPSMDVHSECASTVEETDPNLLLGLVKSFAEALMNAEFDALCDAVADAPTS